jgi:hypothetical protein
VDFVDLLGGRWLAVGLRAIVLARLAARLAGVGLGRALGEGPGLALTGAKGCVELPTEPHVLGLQVVDPSLQGLAVGTPDRFHAGIIRSGQTCSCGSGGRGSVQLEPEALIKYARFNSQDQPEEREKIMRARIAGPGNADQPVVITA